MYPSLHQTYTALVAMNPASDKIAGGGRRLIKALHIVRGRRRIHGNVTLLRLVKTPVLVSRVLNVEIDSP